MPCFRDLMYFFVCMGGGCGRIGGASGELLEEGGYLCCGGCVKSIRMEVSCNDRGKPTISYK